MSDSPAADEPLNEKPAAPVDEGEVLFAEQGGSWWVVAIGPVMVGAVLAMEISGPGQVHWPVMSMFGLILVSFSLVQVYAARRHVSVCLTETTLRQGTRTLPLSEIKKIFPPNESPESRSGRAPRRSANCTAYPAAAKVSASNWPTAPRPGVGPRRRDPAPRTHRSRPRRPARHSPRGRKDN